MWHHSADSENLLYIPAGICGVWSSPLVICWAVGGLTALKVSSAFVCTPTTLFIQMHRQPRCLVVCVREFELITGVIEMYSTLCGGVDGHLPLQACFLMYVSRELQVLERLPKWHALQQAAISATFCTHSGMFRSASIDSVWSWSLGGDKMLQSRDLQ